MTTEQLKKELSDWKRKLEAMKKGNLTAGIAKSEKEIARIESELAELEKTEKKVEFEYDKMAKRGEKSNTPKKKLAKKSKSKLGKSVKEIVAKEETGGNAMVSVDTEKKWKYNSTVKKVSDDHYIILYQSDTKKDAEIKFNNGEWDLICKEIKDYPKFKKGQVEMAINFVLEVKDCIHSKISNLEQSKKKKQLRQKYDELSESEKAANAVDKAAESVEKRVEEAKKEGEVITVAKANDIIVDVKAIVSSIKSGLKENAERKAFITKLINELKKML